MNINLFAHSVQYQQIKSLTECLLRDFLQRISEKKDRDFMEKHEDIINSFTDSFLRIHEGLVKENQSLLNKELKRLRTKCNPPECIKPFTDTYNKKG